MLKVVVRLHGMTTTMECIELDVLENTRVGEVLLKAISKGLNISIPDPSTQRGMSRYLVLVNGQPTTSSKKVVSNCEIALIPFVIGG